MNLTEGQHKARLGLGVLVAIGVQVGLPRILAKACEYAESHEFPARMRGGSGLTRYHRT